MLADAPLGYLRVALPGPVIPAHRHAFILDVSHTLAVDSESLRLGWKEGYRAPVPRQWRLCRFCHAQVEDADGSSWTRLKSANPPLDQRLAVPIAKFIYLILNVFYSMPRYIPAPYLYSPLLLTQRRSHNVLVFSLR